MNANIQILVSVCERLGVPYRVLHPDGNLVAVRAGGCDRIFANWATPLNDQTVARLCRDKDYTYQALSPLMPMPKTRAFLNPQVEPKYQTYVHWPTLAAIINEIEQTFHYPLIVKRNQGTHGHHVFRVDNQQALTTALAQIYNPQSEQYDYIALAQAHIDIATEYRAIFLQGKLMFAYRKDTRHAQYQGNLSPFRWDGATAQLETDPHRLSQLQTLVAEGLQQFNITYTGIDIAIDRQGAPWIVELNASPGFHFLVRDGGQHVVEHLYEHILETLTQTA